MTPSASTTCDQTFKLHQHRNGAPKTADADVAAGVQAVEELAVIEQVRGQGGPPPPTPFGGNVATAEEGLQIRHARTLAGRYTDLSIGINAGVGIDRVSVHIPKMDISERIQKLMEAKGLNPYSLSLKAGVHEDTVRNIIRGATKEPSALKLLKLARVLETSVEHMIDEAAPNEAPSQAGHEITLPVRYKVAAGGWHEVEDIDQGEPRIESAERIDAYSSFPQWLEEVVGDSLDKIIPPGAIAHVVDAVAAGYVPAHDDIVVVSRSRDGGSLVQRTIKQVELGPGGSIELWPRSHNPRWGGPINITHGAASEDLEVRIVGKVVRAYMKFGKK